MVISFHHVHSSLNPPGFKFSSLPLELFPKGIFSHVSPTLSVASVCIQVSVNSALSSELLYFLTVNTYNRCPGSGARGETPILS